MEFQQPLTTTRTTTEDDDDENNSNDDSEVGPPASDELRTYIIIVNDDGSLSLDPNGIVAEDADPQSVIPVHLPVNKMKSADCPLPGATPFPGTSRARKTKPQATLYGGDIEDQEPAVTSTGVSGATAPIDIAQLGPQDIAILENVLQCEQAREMRELLENLSLPLEDIPNSSPNAISYHMWDHNYSNLSAPPQPHQLTPVPPVLSSTPNPLVDHMSMAKSSEDQRTTTPAKSIIKVSFNQNQPSSGKSSNVPPTVTSPAASRLTSSPVPVNSPASRRGSEGESNAIKRRSQRQQDRIERLEAERIMAENQQMLQREKELMMENSNNIAKQVDAPPLPASSNINAHPVSPAPVIDETRVSSPILSSQKPSMPSPSPSVEENTKSDNFKRPARHRKLPAHLADPNYVQLDDDAKSKTSPPAEPETVKEAEPEKEESEEEDADEEADEEDPNKLWCICRKPHNNRFMICCDKCDDWFHGKCVGVTKAQASQMEANHKLWHCPTCRKTLKQQTTPAPKTPKTPGRASSRRGSETSQSSTTSSVDTKPVPEPKKVTAAAAIKAKVSLALEAPKRRGSAAAAISLPKPVGRRKSNSVSVSSQQEISNDDKLPQCIVCSKKTRADSVYCSDDCVRQHATTTIATGTAASKPKDTLATSTTATTPSPSSQKLKRLSSLKDQEKSKEAEQPFFAFHVIQAGAAKSTEVVPPRQKEPTTGPHAKPPNQNQHSNSSTATSPVVVEKAASSGVTGTATKPPAQSPAKNTPQTQQSKAVVSSSTGSSSKRTLSSSSSSKETKDPQTKEKTGAKSTTKSSHEKNGKERKKAKEMPKDREQLDKEKDARHGRDEEALMKENFKKTLGETFKDRLKNVGEEEKANYPSANTPENIAEKIIDELTQLYGSANNVKGKAKYRSIIFNLRDAKNSLFREILQGNISAKMLVKMEATQMASAELSEWRNRENQKNLEMIKKAELDKLVEAKKQELIDKGADVDVAVEEQAKKNLDIGDVIQLKDKNSEEKGDAGGDIEKASSSSKSSHRRDKKKDKRKEKEQDKDKQRDSKDHSSSSKDSKDKDRRSDRHRHRSSRDESKTKDKETKDKESSKDKITREKDKSKPSNGSSHNSVSGKDKDARSERDKDNSIRGKVDKDTVPKIKHSDSSEKLNQDAHTSPSIQKQAPPSSKLKIDESSIGGVRHSTDSEQELPSSTIKTPDFTDEPKKENVQTPVFKTKLIMHELGHFHAVAFHVSHNSLEGTIFPESPVPIVGRISPETVWDYIDKMKKTKEVIVLRLAPESEADSQGYMTFFSYLSSRGRLGVMGGISSPLKDVYLIPLNKHSPINRALLPFRGPGLPKDRNHCLLAVVTRHIVDLPPTIQPKRKASLQLAETASPVSKKKRTTDVGPGESPSSSTNSAAAIGTNRPLSKGSPNSFPPVGKIPGIGVGSSGPVPLADPRRKGEQEVEEHLQNDDDQPYTPWEDDDDKEADVKSEVCPAPVIPVLDDKTAAQKLLEDLNRKIQMEKQEIESIAVAIKRNENITHIPGLDGDFPSKDHSPVPGLNKKDDVPLFFLRSQPIQSKLPLPMMTEPDNEQLLVPATDEPKSNVLTSVEKKSPSVESDCMIVSDVEHVSKPFVSKPEILKEPVSEVVQLDEEEAYSPSSAMDFSDDETEVSKDQEDDDVVEVKDPRTIPTSKNPPVTSAALDSPFVAGAGKQGNELVSEVVPVENVEPLLTGADRLVKIPGLDFSDSIEKESELVVEHSQNAKKYKPEVINLDVEELEEPPPPGESIPSPSIFRTPTKSGLDSVFSLGPPPNLSPKVKIQINLTPKTSPPGIGVPSMIPSPTKSLTTSSLVPTSGTSLPVPATADIPLPPPVAPPPTFSLPPILPTIPTPSVSIPPPGLVSIPIPPAPTIPASHLSVIPPPTLPVTNIQPPVSFPSHSSTTSLGFPRTPNLIPAPPIGGVSINTSIPPPVPIAGMVPVSSIPPLPTLRGMPNLNPIRFPTNINMTKTQSQQQQPPQLNRFRPMGRYPMQSQSSSSSFSSKPPPPEQGKLRQAPPLSSPPGPSQSSSSGTPSTFERKRHNSFNDKNDGSDSKSTSNYQKGSDRFRNSRPSYGNRRRSRSRSGSRSRSTGINRSRSRSRDRNRDRRYRRRFSRSRSPVGISSSRRRSTRSRSPSSSSNRKNSPRRHSSKSRSPSSGRSRRTRRSRSTSPVTSSSSGKI